MVISTVTKPRSQIVSLDDTPYYHCIGRCVRKAFLCGTDGDKNYEHRRQWMLDRIKQLANAFTIDIAAYAIMSNHYHLVLHIDKTRGKALSDSEVIERWLMLHKGPEIIHQHLKNPTTNPVKLNIINEYIDTWRSRLHNLSWFMAELNVYIAKRANFEDKCTGHFWESRFKSQALLDETALFSCMAYVDLNPIRANIANTPEASDYTSIQERLNIVATHSEPDTASTTDQTGIPPLAVPLMKFSGNLKHDTKNYELPYDLKDYLELVDWTGRAIRDDKHGHIKSNIPSLIERLNINPDKWINTCSRIEKDYFRAIGSAENLGVLAIRMQQKWLKGIQACRQLYSKSLPSQ